MQPLQLQKSLLIYVVPVRSHRYGQTQPYLGPQDLHPFLTALVLHCCTYGTVAAAFVAADGLLLVEQNRDKNGSESASTHRHYKPVMAQ